MTEDKGRPKALGLMPGMQLHLSYEPFPSHLKGQQTIMARLRSLIGPSQIRTQTILIGVPTIGLPAVITFKIQLNNITFTCTQVSQIHSITVARCMVEYEFFTLVALDCPYKEWALQWFGESTHDSHLSFDITDQVNMTVLTLGISLIV